MRRANPTVGKPKTTKRQPCHAYCLLVPGHFDLVSNAACGTFLVRRPWAALHCHRRVSTALMSPSMEIVAQTKRTMVSESHVLTHHALFRFCRLYLLHDCATLEIRPNTSMENSIRVPAGRQPCECTPNMQNSTGFRGGVHVKNSWKKPENFGLMAKPSSYELR